MGSGFFMPQIQQNQTAQYEQHMRLGYWQRQAIQMLSMGVRELTESIKREAERNPALEVDYNPTGVYLAEDIAAPPQDLKEWLRIQLATSGYAQLHKLAYFIIESLDENGYLHMNLAETGAIMGIDPMLFKRALALIQTLDPPGVGARSLRECLLLQLLRSGIKNSDSWQLLKFGFEEMNTGKEEELLEKWCWDKQRLCEAIAVLKKLNPFPASSYCCAKEQIIIPDLEILSNKGQLQVRLFDHALPKVSISRGYLEALGADSADHNFAGNGVFYARRFVGCIQKRNETLLNVMRIAVEVQQAYIWGGVKVPLAMKSIAQMLSLHPSTITHAVENKYIQFGEKTFCAGDLFERECAAGLSKGQVMQAIESIVSGENEQVSDEKLMARLQERYSVDIPRRTLAKYRRIMGIPCAKERGR